MVDKATKNLTDFDDKTSINIATERKIPTKDYEEKSQEYIETFLTWNNFEQSLFVKHLLANMDICQHGMINSFLSQMLRRDFIGRLSSCGLEHIAENILEYLDEKSLKSVELVCREWHYIVDQGMLWKKFIERKVLNDRIWYDLSKRRGWHKYLFRQSLKNGDDNKSNVFYRSLYHLIIRDLKQLEINWYTGQYELEKIQCESKHNKGVYCFQYDDEKVICGLRDNTIQIWNRKTLKCIKTLSGHKGSVLCLQYDDKILITGSSDSTIRVWNLERGELINTLLYHAEAVLHLRFIDRTMMTCSKDRSIAVWQIISPNEILLQRALVGHRAAVNVVDFDNKYIVSASGDRTIKVWKTETFDFVRTLVGHKRGIACLQYQDQLVVSGSSDFTIRIWNIECGICLRVLEGHQELVRCVRFDSKVIISGAYDGKIKIWNLQAALDPRSQVSSLCMKTFMEHSGRVFRLQFDQFQILSSSHDDTIVCFNFLQPDFDISTIQLDKSDPKTLNESFRLNVGHIPVVVSSTTSIQSTTNTLEMHNSPVARRLSSMSSNGEPSNK